MGYVLEGAKNWKIILPVKNFEPNSRFIMVSLEGSYLKEAGQKHDESHLMTSTVINPGRVTEPVRQVYADLVNGGMVNGLENFLQLSPTFLQ